MYSAHFANGVRQQIYMQELEEKESTELFFQLLIKMAELYYTWLLCSDIVPSEYECVHPS